MIFVTLFFMKVQCKKDHTYINRDYYMHVMLQVFHDSAVTIQHPLVNLTMPKTWQFTPDRFIVPYDWSKRIDLATSIKIFVHFINNKYVFTKISFDYFSFNSDIRNYRYIRISIYSKREKAFIKETKNSLKQSGGKMVFETVSTFSQFLRKSLKINHHKTMI